MLDIDDDFDREFKTIHRTMIAILVFWAVVVLALLAIGVLVLKHYGIL